MRRGERKEPAAKSLRTDGEAITRWRRRTPPAGRPVMALRVSVAGLALACGGIGCLAKGICRKKFVG